MFCHAVFLRVFDEDIIPFLALLSTVLRYMYLQKVLNSKDLQAFFTALSRRSETAVFMVYLYLMMSFFLLDLQSLKEPFHLLERDLFYFFRRSGPLEFHIIQKFLGRQDKPILIIPEDFYRISFPVTEDEDTVPIIRIQFKAECNSCNQSRDLLAKIRSSTGEENPSGVFCDTLHHNFLSV
jgi:hypothetical protein